MLFFPDVCGWLRSETVMVFLRVWLRQKKPIPRAVCSMLPNMAVIYWSPRNVCSPAYINYFLKTHVYNKFITNAIDKILFI